MIAKRRGDAIELRLAGVDNVTIGKKLAADPSINSDGLSYPYGYGRELYAQGQDPPDDEHLASLVANDLHKVIRERANRVTEGYDEYKAVQEARLERIFVPVWRKALSGDLTAVDRAIRILERQARLHGLDAPARTELTGAHGGDIAISATDQRKVTALAFLDDLTKRDPNLLTQEDLGALAAADGMGLGEGLVGSDLDFGNDEEHLSRRAPALEPAAPSQSDAGV